MTAAEESRETKQEQDEGRHEPRFLDYIGMKVKPLQTNRILANHILIRPRLQRTKRGALRVLQAAAVEKPDDFEPVRQGRGKLSPPTVATGSGLSSETTANVRAQARYDRQLLDKHALER